MTSERLAKLEQISDAVDEVNVLKGEIWNSTSKFDDKKDKTKFRQYATACDRVKDFYLEQHTNQTLQFNIQVRERFSKTTRATMSVWEAIELLNTIKDDSDPDTSLTQIEHLLQTAEAMRRDGQPEWMQVVGLVHDLGKLLCFYQPEGQWAIVGDTFPVGCKFSKDIVYPDTFGKNPDFNNKELMTGCGIYQSNCGLDNVLMSWGHDEYLYRVLKDQCTLPKEGLWMIRYHSFYPWHRENGYKFLCNESDEHALAAVREFNPYDLYSKSDGAVNVEELKPYYLNLISKFFPKMIQW